MNKLIIICNIYTKKKSEQISMILIKKKLSSCISILKNIKSIYKYRKKLCKENEYQIIIKTTIKNKIKIINEIKNIQQENKIFIIKNLII